MSRIGITLSGIERSLLNRLAEANSAATLGVLRMASGQKINAPADDPAAFARLSGLQADLSKVTATMANVTAASSMVTQTQTALGGIRTQLNTIRTELLADQDGSLTGTERAAAQANIDAAIAQINALASTQIDGHRLMDGSANFTISGRNADQVDDIRVYATGGQTITLDGIVNTAATQAELTYNGKAGALIDGDATFTVTGGLGTVEFTVSDDDDLNVVAATINAQSHKTGITAAVDGDDLDFTSVEYGSDAGITIAVSGQTFIVAAGSSTTDTGTDAQATLNGQNYTAEGNRFAFTDAGAHYVVELDPGYTGALDEITVSGDALTFALSTELARSSTLAIPSVKPAYLGGLSGTLSDLASGGTLDGLDTDTSQAIRVVDEALAQLTDVEGAVDGFYNAAISSSSSLLADMEGNLSDAIDDVNLVDQTEEAALVAYYTDLASNSAAGLAIFARQRASIVALIRQTAGLI